MAEANNGKLKSDWAELVREQQASGMTGAEFCQQRELRVHAFYYWRRKLTPGNRARRSTAEKFVPVQVESPAPPGPGCEVVLPDGCRLIVPAQCDGTWLRDVLGALRNQTC